MRFEGRVFFDFGSRDTWQLYRFLTVAAGEGADLALSWDPFHSNDDPAELRALATYLAVRAAAPDRQGSYLQAVLAACHLDGADIAATATLTAAAEHAGVPTDVVHEAASFESAVASSTEEAASLGVTAPPTLYRHGPVMLVRLNPAALGGNVLARLAIIDAALEDDGIWGLVKP